MIPPRLLMLRPAPDNALLHAAMPRNRRALAAAFWMLFYGAPVGAVLFVAYLIGQARLQ
ncbi:hypothetical protein [Burkholderia sp. Bp9031]|uniref:hypothetical protein n=1 Tax=Burkholderia sp. Bp9031 TaxID=2184566 RepID=UPI001639F6CD|nr:hypothetical protein [Burkholderia sp. Bp9031]